MTLACNGIALLSYVSVILIFFYDELPFSVLNGCYLCRAVPLLLLCNIFICWSCFQHYSQNFALLFCLFDGLALIKVFVDFHLLSLYRCDAVGLSLVRSVLCTPIASFTHVAP